MDRGGEFLLHSVDQRNGAQDEDPAICPAVCSAKGGPWEKKGCVEPWMM